MGREVLLLWREDEELLLERVVVAFELEEEALGRAVELLELLVVVALLVDLDCGALL